MGNTNLNSAWAAFSPAEQAALAAIGREAGYRLAASQASVTQPTATTLRLALQVDNLGNAPAYEPWTLQAQVRAITADAPTHIDTTWTLPPSAAPGAYALHLAWVRSPALAGQSLHWNRRAPRPTAACAWRR